MTHDERVLRHEYSLEGIHEHAERIASLEELVLDMWFWGYCGHMDSESEEWQMDHIAGVLDRMAALGLDGGES
ncbi:MAG: hypothetical protein IKG69_00545 [Atopobiaceae bacterium]|nr:hypothetical protein [Atopobiaceae bacterium]